MSRGGKEAGGGAGCVGKKARGRGCVWEWGYVRGVVCGETGWG